jgi:hypothetical protein
MWNTVTRFEAITVVLEGIDVFEEVMRHRCVGVSRRFEVSFCLHFRKSRSFEDEGTKNASKR